MFHFSFREAVYFSLLADQSLNILAANSKKNKKRSESQSLLTHIFFVKAWPNKFLSLFSVFMIWARLTKENIVRELTCHHIFVAATRCWETAVTS